MHPPPSPPTRVTTPGWPIAGLFIAGGGGGLGVGGWVWGPLYLGPNLRSFACVTL